MRLMVVLIAFHSANAAESISCSIILLYLPISDIYFLSEVVRAVLLKVSFGKSFVGSRS